MYTWHFFFKYHYDHFICLTREVTLETLTSNHNKAKMYWTFEWKKISKIFIFSYNKQSKVMLFDYRDKDSSFLSALLSHRSL